MVKRERESESVRFVSLSVRWREREKGGGGGGGGGESGWWAADVSGVSCQKDLGHSRQVRESQVQTPIKS